MNGFLDSLDAISDAIRVTFDPIGPKTAPRILWGPSTLNGFWDRLDAISDATEPLRLHRDAAWIHWKPTDPNKKYRKPMIWAACCWDSIS